MKIHSLISCAILGCSLSGSAFAVESHPRGSWIEGRVAEVLDGDTITVIGADRSSVRVRFLGVDAPEKSQPFGPQCREALSGRVAGEEVRVQSAGQDTYGRILGKVVLRGQDQNVVQLQAGCAWHYAHYASEQFGSDADRYARAESGARTARRGLWQDRDPEAPWDYRRRTRDEDGSR